MIDFIENIKNTVPGFIDGLYKKDGFYSWSKDDDLYDIKLKWGLANTVFAVKTLSLLNKVDGLFNEKKQDIVSFIRAFENSDGTIHDPLIYKKTHFFNKLLSVRQNNYSNFFNQKTIMAETRQAIVALLMLGEKPKFIFSKTPDTKKKMQNYIDNLHWDNIWGAASHLGHAVFFLKINSDLFGFSQKEAECLIDICLKKLDSIQDEKSGMWLGSDLSTKLKVNGAMKVISIYNLLDFRSISLADKIIDFILDPANQKYYYDGCDNLNVLFVLKYAYDSCAHNYKEREVKDFCEQSLLRLKKYFFEDKAGFSFLPNSFERNLYGFKITKEFQGPDIHGTFLMTWAVALINSILNKNNWFEPDVMN